jgi:hypothetical protein
MRHAVASFRPDAYDKVWSTINAPLSAHRATGMLSDAFEEAPSCVLSSDARMSHHRWGEISREYPVVGTVERAVLLHMDDFLLCARAFMDGGEANCHWQLCLIRRGETTFRGIAALLSQNGRTTAPLPTLLMETVNPGGSS